MRTSTVIESINMVIDDTSANKVVEFDDNDVFES